MKIDQITSSILTVISDNDISKDLACEQTKSIAKLLEEKNEEKEESGQPPQG